jgi:hypothetical protein
MLGTWQFRIPMAGRSQKNPLNENRRVILWNSICYHPSVYLIYIYMLYKVYIFKYVHLYIYIQSIIIICSPIFSPPLAPPSTHPPLAKFAHLPLRAGAVRPATPAARGVNCAAPVWPLRDAAWGCGSNFWLFWTKNLGEKRRKKRRNGWDSSKI